MTSILEGQPPKIKAFSNQNKGHLGSRYIQIFEGQPFFWWVGGHRLTTDDGWAPLNLTEATAISHPFFWGEGGGSDEEIPVIFPGQGQSCSIGK